MVKIRQQKTPLTVQAYKLKNYFPESKCYIRNNELVWKGYLQPSELGLKYLIKIVYRRGKHPDVYVMNPKPLVLAEGKTELEHVYNTEKQHICIYYKRANEWDETKSIADIIIPWVSEWLLHYEYWVATGAWHGGGIH